MERPIKGTKLIGWKEILELKKESQLIKAPLKSSGQAIYWSTDDIWKMGYFGKIKQIRAYPHIWKVINGRNIRTYF